MNEYVLKYQKTIGRDYQWTMFFEYSDIKGLDWSRSDKEIIDFIIGHGIYNRVLNDKEIQSSEIVSLNEFIRPFNFDVLSSDNFSFLKTKDNFIQVFEELEKDEDWDEDLSEFILLKSELLDVLFERSEMREGLWYLNLSESNDSILDLAHWIYSYYLVLIEIDRENSIVRITEIGYD